MLEEMKQLRQDVNRQIEVIFASLIQRYEGTYRYCVPLFREWLLEDDVNALLEHWEPVVWHNSWYNKKQAQQRAESLAAKLRALGIDPDKL